MSKCEERQSFLLQSGILLCKGSKNTFTCKVFWFRSVLQLCPHQSMMSEYIKIVLWWCLSSIDPKWSLRKTWKALFITTWSVRLTGSNLYVSIQTSHRFTAGWIIRTRGGAEEHIFGSEAVLQRAWVIYVMMNRMELLNFCLVGCKAFNVY